MLLEFLDAADLSDAEADTVVAILLPKLWWRSGLDLFAFRAAVGAVLSPAKADSVSTTRH